MLTSICLTSSFNLLLGPLLLAVSSSGRFVCWCVFPLTLFFFCPWFFCFFLVPGNSDCTVFFKTSAVFVFLSGAGLHDTLGLGYWGCSGAWGCEDSCGSVLLAVLLRGAFSSFDAGSLLALRVLVFASDGLHSSLSSSLLAVWENDLTGE